MKHLERVRPSIPVALIWSVGIVLAIWRMSKRHETSSPTDSVSSRLAGAVDSLADEVAGLDSSAKKARWWDRAAVRDLAIAVLAGVLAVWLTAYLDNARADREAAQAERLGWRTTFATNSQFEGIDLAKTDLSGFYMTAKNLSGSNLGGADLRRSSLLSTDLMHASLEGANLERANLTGSTIRGAALTNSDLREANLTRTDVSGVDFTTARNTESMRATEVCYNYETRWPGKAPSLDWRSCWSGYSNDKPPQDRVRPEPQDCGYDEPFSTLKVALREITVPSGEAVCDFLSYLEAMSVPGSADVQASRGSFACQSLQRGDGLEDALLWADPTEHKTDRVAGMNVLFGAASYLCPSTLEDLQGALKAVSAAGQ